MTMRCITILIILLFVRSSAIAQEKASIEQYNMAGTNRRYTPMFLAHYQNNKKWYVEGRYNYEELETFSAYIGKTFSKNDNLSYSITPLVGGALGDFNGISAGLNVEADYKKFFFSLQSQYAVSTDHRQNNFFYNWSELAYQPLPWLYGGVSIQQTHLFENKSILEPGILAGVTFRNMSIPIYIFAPFNKSRYFIVGLIFEWKWSSGKSME